MGWTLESLFSWCTNKKTIFDVSPGSQWHPPNTCSLPNRLAAQQFYRYYMGTIGRTPDENALTNRRRFRFLFRSNIRKIEIFFFIFPSDNLFLSVRFFYCASLKARLNILFLALSWTLQCCLCCSYVIFNLVEPPLKILFSSWLHGKICYFAPLHNVRGLHHLFFYSLSNTSIWR